MTIHTRIMDVVMAEANGTYTRTVHGFENPAQVDSMRDMLLAQDNPAYWVVMAPSTGWLGQWCIIYSGLHKWNVIKDEEARQSLGS